MYQKKIAYLNYIENGVRIKNVGHARISVRDEKYVLEINIKGLYQTDSLTADVYALGPGIVITTVLIHEGAGRCSGVFNTFDIGGSGMDAWQMNGLMIRLSEARKIEAEWRLERPAGIAEPDSKAENRIQSDENKKVSLKIPEEREHGGAVKDPGGLQAAEGLKNGQLWKDRNRPAGGQAEETEAASWEPGNEEIPWLYKEQGNRDSAPPAGEGRGREGARPAEEPSGGEHGDGCRMGCRVIDWDKAMEREKTPEAGRTRERGKDAEGQRNQRYDIGQRDTGGEKEGKEVVYDDKWTQLCHSYKQIHPFGEDTYISLAPKDFVILRKEYQHLVNNSFLLHGYYNYRHIILGRMNLTGQETYYLGVPGTYYDREKMVAVMFGFESFEMSNGGKRQEEGKRPDESIEPGTFGYYLRKVEI